MLLGRTCFALVGELRQGAANAEARIARFNHVIDVAILGCLIGIGEEFVVFVLFFGQECFRVGIVFGFFCVEDGYSAAGSHDGHFG